MAAESGDEPLRTAVVAYVVVQRRLIARLREPGRDLARIETAMTAELDQLAAAVHPGGGQLGTHLRADPGA